MPYYKLLRDVILKSGYTQEQVAQKCKEEQGIEKISKSYINKLSNNKQQAPSDEISRAIARVCNFDERKLVIEGYLDKAPKEIRDIFISLKYNAMLISLNAFENKLTKKEQNTLKKLAENETLSEFVVSLIDNSDTILDFNENGIELKSSDEKLTLSNTNNLFKAKDNSMYPLIKENDEIVLEVKSNYINGDIVAFSKNGEMQIRQIVNIGRQIETIPLNKEYNHKTYNKEDICILGKVKKIITAI